MPVSLISLQLYRLDGAEDLGRGLDELRLLGIAGLELFENFLRVAHASSNDGKRKVSVAAPYAPRALSCMDNIALLRQSYE